MDPLACDSVGECQSRVGTFSGYSRIVLFPIERHCPHAHAGGGWDVSVKGSNEGAILKARIVALETALVEYVERHGLTEKAAIALSSGYILASEGYNPEDRN